MASWEWDIETDEVVWSENAATMMGYRLAEFENSSNFYFSQIYAEDAQMFFSALEHSLNKKSEFRLEYRIRKKDGSLIWVVDVASVMFNDNGKPSKMFGVIQNITKRREYEADSKIKENALQNSINGVALADATGKLTYVNRAFLRMWGYENEDEVIGRDVFGFWQNPADAVEIVEGLRSYNSWAGEKIATRKDGTFFYCQISANFLKDEKGTITHFMGSFWDTTERKQHELFIDRSLQEKELLLKEIHHRVKNNLQIVSSLIYLQSLNISDSKTRELFTQSLNRIKSIAVVHELLYQSENLEEININQYIGQLVYIIKDTFFNSDISISLNVDPNLSINLNQAVYCGLIVNELLNNSIKYAFTDGRKGMIMVTFDKQHQNYYLTVVDNGVGVSDTSIIDSENTIGFKIIKTLAKQLKGTIQFKSQQGTSITLNFPVNPTTSKE